MATSYLDGLFSFDIAALGALIADVDGVNFGADFVATRNAATRHVDVSLASSIASLTVAGAITAGTVNAGALSLGSATPPQYAVTVGATVSSVNASVKTLATIAIPAGESVDIDIAVNVVLGPGQVNANLAPTIYRSRLTAYRVGSGSAAIAGATDDSDISPPFLAITGSTIAGALTISASGNNILVQATGFAAPSAWASSHAYVRGDNATIPGDFVTANGNVYVCTTSGTSSGSAPSGTGRGLGTGAKFDYVAAGTAVPIDWTLTKQETRTG